MGLLNLVTNTVEGVTQTALGATKVVVGGVIGALDDGKTLDSGVKNMSDGVDKIGKSEERMMTEAPEKIWVWTSPQRKEPRRFWTTGFVDAVNKHEYTRTDHVEELIAAAYEAAAYFLSNRSLEYPNSVAWCVEDDAEEILSLTSDDARAALEARDKRVREEALREAMNIYRKAACDETSAEAEILALIEKDTDT